MSIELFLSYIHDYDILKGTQLRGRIPKPFYGVLPLCYVSWLCYASYLVFKISYLFKNEVVNLLDKQDIFGPQLLKLAVSISTVIFILLVAAHHDAEKVSFHLIIMQGMK